MQHGSFFRKCLGPFSPEFDFSDFFSVLSSKKKVLDPAYRTVFFAAFFSFVAFLYMLGKYINSKVWYQEVKKILKIAPRRPVKMTKKFY